MQSNLSGGNKLSNYIFNEVIQIAYILSNGLQNSENRLDKVK